MGIDLIKLKVEQFIEGNKGTKIAHVPFTIRRLIGEAYLAGIDDAPQMKGKVTLDDFLHEGLEKAADAITATKPKRV